MGIMNLLSSIFKVEPVVVEPDAGIEDIETIYRAIQNQSEDGVFVVFMPHTPRDGEEDVLNIQFSIENGKLGLDWILLSPINKAEVEFFKNLCEENSLPFESKSMNGCDYLRVEQGDLAALCKNAILGLYPKYEGKCLDLVVEGFDLPEK